MSINSTGLQRDEPIASNTGGADVGEANRKRLRIRQHDDLSTEVPNAPLHDIDVVDLDAAKVSRAGLVPLVTTALKAILRTVEIATAAREAVFGGGKLDLAGMPSADLLLLVSRLSVAALELRGLPQGTAATRTLTRALHTAGLAQAERGGGDVDYAGLIIAIAFQCSQVQGLRGRGVDAKAIAWAGAYTRKDGAVE